MAGGTYKSGVAIDLVYQAAALLSNAIPNATVYDEGDALDTVKSTSLTSSLLAGELSGVAVGSYRGSFTPDAEGPWTVIIEDKNNAGQVSKIYNVCGHNIDSIGDAVAALPATISDIESALNIAVSGVAALDTADVASQLLITQSAINVATASDTLLKQSSIISSLKSDLLLKQSSIISSVKSNSLVVQSTISGYISNVESAVDLLSSPAMVS